MLLALDEPPYSDAVLGESELVFTRLLVLCLCRCCVAVSVADEMAFFLGVLDPLEAAAAAAEAAASSSSAASSSPWWRCRPLLDVFFSWWSWPRWSLPSLAPGEGGECVLRLLLLG